MSPKKKDKCTIREEELAKWFSIDIDRLDEIVDFFDSDPDDEWDLVEGTDYKFINRTDKIRIYAPGGALKIAYYLDRQKRSLWHTIVEFLTRHEARLRGSLARRLINEELAEEGKLISRNGRSMMHKQSLRRILETNGSRFNKAFEDIRQSPLPMEPRKDFEELESELWFAASGAEKMAKELGEKLTNKARRKMCLAIGEQVEPALKMLENARMRREREIKEAIKSAKRRVRNRDKKTCQITGQVSNSKNRTKVAVHHLYSASEYPHLAANVDNLITIEESIHERFHGWMGGFDKACTLDDFLQFLHECYADAPGTEALSARLHQLKGVLGK